VLGLGMKRRVALMACQEVVQDLSGRIPASGTCMGVEPWWEWREDSPS
jgi:hypothetical protein